MKFWEIFRFEVAYQVRRPWPWLSFLVLIVFAFVSTRVAIVPVTLPQDFIINSPFIITSVSVFSCQIWLLLAPAVAGEAAARDVHTRMYPLLYASPISKLEYLGGRFLAAVVLNALILLGVQIGSLLAAYAPGGNPEIVGPFRPAAYLAAYVFIGLTNAFVATTIQFFSAAVSGRPMASYVGSFALFFLSYPVTVAIYFSHILPADAALMTDPIGVFAIMNEMMSNWTIVEKNVRMFALEGPMLWNRLLWLGIALATLAILYLRFRFAHRTASQWLSRFTRRFAKQPTQIIVPAPIAVAVPHVHQSFDFATHLRQTLAIAASSFAMIARSPAGLFLLFAFPMFVVVVLLGASEQWGVPLLPRTGYIVSKHLTSPLTQFADYRVIIPLLIIYFAGELIWRERDARLSENVDATSVPEWVLFLGKFVGLGLILAALMVSMAAAGMLAQTIMGYHDFRIGLYLQFLLGLQLPEYLIFAVLAFLVHAVVNHKYLGQLAAFVLYLCIVFSSFLGIKHNLLIYGAGPDWSYTDMRGFGSTVGPWLWFKLYWIAWALLLALVTRVVWVRGRESGIGARLQIARRRVNRSTLGVAVMTVALIFTLGGFIVYNTNVLNEFITEDEMVERRAE